MEELSKIENAVKPNEIFYVADAMSGQDAVNSAAEFSKYVGVTGIILSKTDGDARGGAALSVKEVTGKPLVFVGTGEKLNDLELFHPSRMASIILGMGDVVSLVEKAQAAIEEEVDADEMAKKIQKSGLNFEDLLKQFKMLKKMGSFGSLLQMLPGMGQFTSKLQGVSLDDKRFKHAEAIILSMTPKERKKPELLNSSRKKRIALGSGRTVQELNRLVEQLNQTNKMVKKLGKGDLQGIFK
jgi:signal recognition particle subunit SRP54